MSGLVHVEGVALWSGRLPGWPQARAILRGEAEPPATPVGRPAPALLAPTERRRAPDTVAIALEVAKAACEDAGRDPATLPSVFASTHGDLAISDYMCDTLAKTPTLVSPIRFHNSVHNAAAGYWTIGTGCMAPYTAISAWTHTFGAALLEAFAQLATGDAPVLLVAYDVEARGPMAGVVTARAPLGAGLVLARSRTPAAKFALRWRSVSRAGANGADGLPPHGADAAALPARLAALAPDSPLAGALAFYAALAAGAPATVVQGAGPRLALELELSPLIPATEETAECRRAST